MRIRWIPAVSLAVLMMVGAGAYAQMDHQNHGMGTVATSIIKGVASPSSQAFAAANAKMHEAMNIEYTGNADIDFVRGMIAHHEGAIAMAKAALGYGSDPKIRKLAEDIIVAQEQEVAMMKEWLKEKGAE